MTRLTTFERVLSLFTSVRPGEGASVLYLGASGFSLLASQLLLKPVREALILTEGSPEIRSYVQAAVAVMLIFLLPLYKQLFTGLADSVVRSRILRWVIGFFICVLLIFLFLHLAGLRIAVPFYIWLSIFNVMVVAQFWAFCADIFNTKSGQRLFVVIMVGASLGALVGAQASKYLIGVIGSYGLMLLAAAVLLLPLGLSILAEARVPHGSHNHEPPKPEPIKGFLDMMGGFDTVFRSRYLRVMALFMLLLNLLNSMGEYIISRAVDARANLFVALPEATLSKAEFIGQFYADYHALITILSLALQLLIVSRLFRFVGIRGTILVLPLFAILHYGALLVIPAFALIRALMIGENALYYSVQNTTTQALYLPLSRREKYVGKTIIDTFFVRLGDLAATGVVVVLAVWLQLALAAFFWTGLALGVIVVWCALELRKHHRGEIRKRLSNLPPRIVAPLPKVCATSGQLLMFSVPDVCFFDPDPGDTLQFKARLEGGQPLPQWIRFDRYNQTFTVRPPQDASGSLQIMLTASDYEGLEVSGTFRFDYGENLGFRVESVVT